MTSWREKLRLTRETLRTVPELVIVFDEGSSHSSRGGRPRTKTNGPPTCGGRAG